MLQFTVCVERSTACFREGEDSDRRGQAVRAGHPAEATQGRGPPRPHLLTDDQDDRPARGTC